MADSERLDVFYQEWLEIPADRLPPNHYALLGLADFESDVEKIVDAAKSRSAHLHQLASGPQRKIVQQMLGQVAMAKRTLVDPQLRQEYEDSIRTVALQQRENSAGQPEDSAKPEQTDSSAATKTARTGRSRSRAGAWKYHAVSAAVLLGIVGIFWFVNRNPGGRRAAEVSPRESSSSNASQGTPNAAATDVQARRENQRRKAPPTPPESTRSATPIAKPRKRGSGIGSRLGSGIGGDFQSKFGSVLSEISEQPGSDTNSSGSGSFQPMGGLAIGKTNRSAPKKPPKGDLRKKSYQPIDGFPKQWATIFDSELVEEMVDAAGDSLVFTPASGGSSRTLKISDRTLKPGEAVRLVSTISAQARHETRIALSVDGIQLGLKSTKKGLEIFARDRGDAADESLSVVGRTPAPAVLLVGRSKNKPNELHWFVQAGTAKGQRRQSGTISAINLPGESPISIVFRQPGPNGKSPLAIRQIGIADSAAQ
ncbi:MAG: hypothetical protein AAFV88_01750 [Planctomycetota bacterium]